MKKLKYQEEAVADLVKKVVGILSWRGSRYKLVFKAPTSAGKTVMASEMLLRLNEELHDNVNAPYNEVAFIWIAPNKLHEQSYFKMKSYFTETRDLHPVVYDNLDHSIDGYIKPCEILFVNWESINRDNAVIIRDTELSASLYDITRRTQENHGLPLIVIIDEEHLFAGRQANRSEQVLRHINPQVEIRISATPITGNLDEMVNVPREKVIAEQMIKEGISLNPALNFSSKLGTLNQQLVHLTLAKRIELADAYRKLGVNINPLLLIQMPNDSSESMTPEDNTVRDEVLYSLETAGITTTNGKLAIWLSNEKVNLENIEMPDNLTEVLLFKQAIALGWDCPRAAVLLMFRKVESFTFTAQTVGRILRMSEQKFYVDDRLNKGYVYTNLSKDIIEIVRDDMDYFSTLHAVRRENLVNVTLTAVSCERPSLDMKRLGSDFKGHLNGVFETEWGVKNVNRVLFPVEEQLDRVLPEKDREACRNQQTENREKLGSFLLFSVGEISSQIVDDLEITGEVGRVSVKAKTSYVRTSDELKIFYTAFCTKLIGVKFEKVSVVTLCYTLTELLEDLFGLHEEEAIKVVLCGENRPKFEDILSKALESYRTKLQTRQQEKYDKSFKEYEWELPADRLYNEEAYRVRDEVKKHALMPYVEMKNASSPEIRFTQFLEKNGTYIDWWYKNGDVGQQHFTIDYINSMRIRSLFYIDFIIQMKNGEVFLFDTKSPGSDPDAPAKHNALIDYIQSGKNGDKLLGGVIIELDGNWKYCPEKIGDTTEETVRGWSSLYPDQYGE